MADILKTIGDWLITEGVKVLIAVAVIIISFILINIIVNGWCKRLLKKKKTDKTITAFVFSAIKTILKILVFVAMIGYLGVQTSSISAAIASVGLAIGLALQGSLSNLAGGFIIVVTHPFKIGDFVEIGETSGTVERIELFYTYITTSQNQVVLIPNSSAANTKIKNYSVKSTRRLDLVFSISYENNFNEAKKIIADCIDKSEKALKTPEPFIGVTAQGENSIDITAKIWVKNDDYWTFNTELLESVKTAFDLNNITIPYNQLDVHLKNEAKGKTN